VDVVAPTRLAGSFRDPSGFVYRRDGEVLRQVSQSYAAEFDALLRTGLYDELSGNRLLTPHEELSLELAADSGAFRVLKPEQVPFISYPYEWSFSQLRDAALLTLDIQERALGRGMTLKDASAYNVQFVNGSAIHIDTLSFENYVEGAPWPAYRQFCQHFLAPLLLMSHVDIRLGRLLQLHLDGIPVDLASRLLPRRTWLRFGPLLHVHMHARSLAKHTDTRLNQARTPPRVSLTSQLGLIDSLASTVRSLSWKPAGTEWADYTSRTNYVDDAHAAKARLVGEYLDQLSAAPEMVWDLGANTGLFSRIAAQRSADVVAFDIDPAAVEQNYVQQRADGGGRILPLLLDLTNPSPGIGWANEERDAWTSRAAPDAVLALALVHHLAIANNLPLPHVATLLSSLTPVLIIEFAPRSDSQVQRLLGSRRDIFGDYTQAAFEAAFGEHFLIRRSDAIPASERRMYLMERR
jgi:hypothetical protein